MLELSTMNALATNSGLPVGPAMTDPIVEIGLLLPAKRAEALIALSRQRGQSVAQILRGLIERELDAVV
jgi:hypothetical protein